MQDRRGSEDGSAFGYPYPSTEPANEVALPDDYIPDDQPVGEGDVTGPEPETTYGAVPGPVLPRAW